MNKCTLKWQEVIKLDGAPSSYKIRWSSIIVLRTEELSKEECVSGKIKQFQGLNVNFPIQSINLRSFGVTKKLDFKGNRIKNILRI